ncbi:tetratricopeptide repeat-containing sensor histidine kinase [Chryseosolibacter indicus]|uniref:Tetratricopeptide repeat protein n=1 Tax=Chryseosolibacter indicus TaxID=2782351 RepID=A0ABS5VT74_9BACT|nr:tetratricopeptide repeat protein [Chryseosolibacter indicus]MBT1704635.1 tetratricopeptide repeat protein [Chryseosolibacter indicus]
MVRTLLLLFIFLHGGKTVGKHVNGLIPPPFLFMGSEVGDTLQVKFLLDAAKVKTDNGELDSARYYFLKAGTLAKRLHFNSGYFKYAGAYAHFLYRQLQFKEALRVSEEHLQYAMEVGNKAMVANAYNNIGVQCHALGDLDRSAENYILAIKASESLSDNKNIHKYYSNLASIFLDLKDKKKCLYYARKGYETAQLLKDTARIGNSLVNLSCSEILNEQFDDAKAHLNQLISIAYKGKNMPLVMDGYINLGEVALLQQEYELALEWNKKALSLMDDNSPPDYAIYIYDGLAKSYEKLGQFEKAEACFEKSLRQAESANFTMNELKELYLFGANLKEKLKKPYAALVLRKKYDVLKDSILNETTQSRVHEMELKYQTTLKEKTLAQQKLLIARHEYEIQRKNKWIILSVSGLFFICSGGLIIFLFYRHRARIVHASKRAMLLQAQINGEEQERTRQARELHDGVVGILSAAKMHLSLLKPCQNDEENKKLYEKALSLITDAGIEVRNISHNLAPEILLQEGFENAIRDFCRRVSHSALRINFYAVTTIPKLSPPLELLIYRIVQESVNNIIKHAQATFGIVQVGMDNGCLSLTIEDDGKGFDVKNIQFKGLGIQNLIARIESVGGTYELSSAYGKGTTIHLICDVRRYLTESSIQPVEAKAQSGISGPEVIIA